MTRFDLGQGQWVKVMNYTNYDWSIPDLVLLKLMLQCWGKVFSVKSIGQCTRCRAQLE